MMQEPESAGERDISCIRRLLDMKRSSWERNWAEYKVKLEQKQQLCQFDTDLANINHHLDDLSKQLITIRGQYGESLSSAKSTSLAFLYFEKTVQVLPFVNELDHRELVSIGIEVIEEFICKVLNISAYHRIANHILELTFLVVYWNYCRTQALR